MHLQELKQKSPADLLAYAEELEIENQLVAEYLAEGGAPNGSASEGVAMATATAEGADAGEAEGMLIDAAGEEAQPSEVKPPLKKGKEREQKARRHERGPLKGAATNSLAGVQQLLHEAAELRVGEMSVHHALTVHGSEPNRSPMPRRALVVNVFGDGTYFDDTDAARDTGGLVLAGVPRVAVGARLEGQFFPLLHAGLARESDT